ncbi:MAG: TolC family protein [[Clostridium] fimetarium]|nr:TolC family protein [Alistipes timonensis]MCM1404863.1 TolC family protein [[Clostridium] fimetarium]
MKSNKIALTLATGAALSMLSSCHIYKKFDMPTDTPDTREYAEVSKQTPDSLAFGNLQWQQVFTDPLLQDFIARALVNNNDLENARLNVEVARANVLGARLSYLPSVALSAQGNLSKFHDVPMMNEWSKTYTIPLSISWEFDVFGKTLNRKRGAEAALRLQQDYQQAVRSQIIGAVATTYYSISCLESQLTLSRETAELWKQSVQTMKDFKEAGRTTEAAVVQSEGQLYSILAQIAELEASLDAANNTFALLLNESPRKYAIPGNAHMSAPAIIRDGVPMRELAQRPDVRAAEESLATAYYATNSARANFYPSLSFTSNGGFTNSVGSFIMNPGKWFENLVGSLTAPLFSRGANIANLKGSKAQQQQALNNFRYKLLSAAAEVQDNIVNFDKQTEKATLLVKQVDALSKAVEYTNDLFAYNGGSTTYLEVLTAQSSLLSAQMNYLSTELARDRALISLYQSLGGGR